MLRVFVVVTLLLASACAAQAPGFRLRDAQGRHQELRRLRQQGPVVVVFYRGYG